MKRIIAVCMLMVLIVSQTACTFSRNNDRAVIPGSSITPAPGAAKEIKGDGENPTLTGVLTLRDADTGRMRFVDIKTGTEYEVPYTGSTDIQDAKNIDKLKIVIEQNMRRRELIDKMCGM